VKRYGYTRRRRRGETIDQALTITQKRITATKQTQIIKQGVATAYPPPFVYTYSMVILLLLLQLLLLL